ncbi:MAG: glycine--tRNA ligase subunit beta [Nitrosomonadales bacterium]
MKNNTKSLLIEILSEELPPDSQKNMAIELAQKTFSALQDLNFINPDEKYNTFSTPRRLAVTFHNVAEKSPDTNEKIKLMPKKIGLVGATIADPLKKKLAGLGIKPNIDNLIIDDEIIYVQHIKRGISLEDFFNTEFEKIVNTLPIKKLMSYQLNDGWTTVNFARPIKNFVALHGNKVINAFLFGKQSNNLTNGHRFESSKEKILVDDAANYEQKLLKDGGVIVDFEKRKKNILDQLQATTVSMGKEFQYIQDQQLLDEVTTLVEKPNVLVGQFNEIFLKVPAECLILSMQTNQKYFPILKEGKLTNKFLIVSNICPKDPSLIIAGNEKVIYPRLADAQFFFNQDKIKQLDNMTSSLKDIIYHEKLGSLHSRCDRVKNIFDYIHSNSNLETNEDSSKLCLLAKADLNSLMVGEFPELQGTMGKYYAYEKKYSTEFSQAIEDQYKPKNTQDSLPSLQTGLILSLAEKFTTLIDLFSIGEKPSGVKDPFALRRNALSIIKIIIEKNVNLNLNHLIDNFFDQSKQEENKLLKNFIFDRLENYLKDLDYDILEIKSLVDSQPGVINNIFAKLEAIHLFHQSKESDSLAQSNKRVKNILKKYEQEIKFVIDEQLFENDTEQQLYKLIEKIEKENITHYDASQYKDIFSNLILLTKPIDDFFEKIMVNHHDSKIKHNRHELLAKLSQNLNMVADISIFSQ